MHGSSAASLARSNAVAPEAMTERAAPGIERFFSGQAFTERP